MEFFMKKCIVLIVIAFAVMSINNGINAYFYKTKNKSGKDLIIQVERQTDTDPYFQRVNDDKEGYFGDEGLAVGLCLNNIKCIINDKAFKKALEENKIVYPDDINGAEAFRNEARAKLLKFLEDNDATYRKTAIYRNPDGSRYDGPFCSSRTFTITYENGVFYATYE
jgi:hypothetical protein